MARQSNTMNPMPLDGAFDLGFQFLQARRAQNLSWMRMVEQSLRTLAEVQRGFGGGGDTLARLSSAHAGVVRDAARVYGLATSHLAR
jgi:hypothetical protein